MKKLSIITVCLNNKEGLEETIKSVAGQSFSDFEFVIVDGGSTDGSVELIKQNSINISWWVSEKDNGIYNAMNKGIGMTTGDYLLFLNSGDILVARNTLQNVFLQIHEEEIIYGDLIVKKGTRKYKKIRYPEKLGLYHFYAPVNSIHHQASFIKRKLFERYGLYREDMRIAADWEFFLRTIIINNCSTKHIPEYVSIFDIEGISSGGRNNEEEFKRNILESHFSKEELDECEMLQQKRVKLKQKLKAGLSTQSLLYKLFRAAYIPFARAKEYFNYLNTK